MVNTLVVNGGSSCLAHAAFCVSFHVSGRFLPSKYPFKYNRNFRVNHKTVHFAPGCGRRPSTFTPQYQQLRLPLTVLEEFSSNLRGIRQTEPEPGFEREMGKTGLTSRRQPGAGKEHNPAPPCCIFVIGSQRLWRINAKRHGWRWT